MSSNTNNTLKRNWVKALEKFCREQQEASNMSDDPVSHPKHYQFKQDCREVREVISDRVERLLLSSTKNKSALLYDYTNAIKYLLRWMDKDGEKDLRKCKFCIDSMLHTLTQSEATTNKLMERESDIVPEYIHASWKDRSHVAIVGDN